MMYAHGKNFSTLPQSTVLSLIYTIEEEYRIQNSEFRIQNQDARRPNTDCRPPNLRFCGGAKTLTIQTPVAQNTRLNSDS